MTMSPWSISGRQNRDTSRAHPGSGRPLCAEAAETIKTKGTASKNLVIWNAFLPTKRTRSKAGAARGTRTPDPVITNDVLYQLSYCGGPCSASGDCSENAPAT